MYANVVYNPLLNELPCPFDMLMKSYLKSQVSTNNALTVISCFNLAKFVDRVKAHELTIKPLTYKVHDTRNRNIDIKIEPGTKVGSGCN